MSKYEVIIYWSNEDSAFIAEVPELPGCAAHGATQEEALRSVNRPFSCGLTRRFILVKSRNPRGRRLVFA